MICPTAPNVPAWPTSAVTTATAPPWRCWDSPLERTGADRDVYLIFQPAEEVGAGGEACAALLKEEGIGEVYAFHNMPGYPLHTVALRRGHHELRLQGGDLPL